MAQPLRQYEALIARGIEHAGQNRFDEAILCFGQALALKPGNLAARVNQANVLALAGRWDEAEKQFRAVLARTRDDAAFNGLGNCLKQRGALAEAHTAYRRALAANRNNADAWNNIGEVEKHLGNWRDALAAYDRAIAIAPKHRDARYGRALLRLSLGQWAGGFEDYRARPAIQDATGLTREPLPADLSGKRVHVRWDQGLGDELFFLRFLPRLRARRAFVSYAPDPRLAAMLARAGIADHIGAPPAVPDYRTTVGDLPHLLGMGDGDPPPPSIRLSVLADRIPELPHPCLGVSWRAGTPDARGALFKAVDRDALARALASYPGTVIAVQRKPQPGEVDAFAAALGRPVLDLTAANDDIESILALVGALDEYVCVSNTNVHLRAALGRTARVLVPHPPEFRWMAAGTSPWFPGTAVYRQGVDGDWATALRALSQDFN